jgi:hypothetical protein
MDCYFMDCYFTNPGSSHVLVSIYHILFSRALKLHIALPITSYYLLIIRKKLNLECLDQ